MPVPLARSAATAAMLLLAVAWSDAPAREYTTEELRRLVDAGNPPEQGEPETVRDESMPFEVCLAGKARVLEAASADYPSAEVLRSPASEIDTLWTPEGVVQITCSRAGERMRITRSPYL